MKKFSWTKVTSSHRTSRNKKLVRAVWLFAALILLLFLAPKILSTAASLVLSPIIATQSWLRESSSAFPQYFRDRSSLIETERELRQKIAELESTNFEANWLYLENAELKRMHSGSSTPRLGAAVIGRPTELPYDVLVLDRGSDDGVMENAPVFLGRDRVIGMIAKVFPKSSVAVLVSTAGIKSTVYIYGPNIYTTAVGQGGGSVRVGVPQGISIKVGDIVAIPSFNSGIYGAISTIDTSETRPEQFGYVSMDVPLRSLHFVTIGQEALLPVTFDEAKEAIEKIRRELLEVSVPSGVLVDIRVDTGTTSTSTNATTTP